MGHSCVRGTLMSGALRGTLLAPALLQELQPRLQGQHTWATKIPPGPQSEGYVIYILHICFIYLYIYIFISLYILLYLYISLYIFLYMLHISLYICTCNLRYQDTIFDSIWRFPYTGVPQKLDGFYWKI